MQGDGISFKSGFSFGGVLKDVLAEGLLHSHFVANTPRFKAGSDSYWMLEALRESMNSVGITHPNPAVGCVLVDAEGREISRGATQFFRGKHAERIAFEKASPARLKGATAYVTLEPCSHHGNQPPCVDLFLNSEVKRIVVSRPDPHRLVAGQGLAKLRAAGKEIKIGPLCHEVSGWSYAFLAQQFLKRPVVALKWAQTLDGQLCDDSDQSQWITGPAARAYTHWLRLHYDLVLIGAKTALMDFSRLNARDCRRPSALSREPMPVILDLKGRCFEISQEVQKRLESTTFQAGRQVVVITQKCILARVPRHWPQLWPHVKVLAIEGHDPIPEVIQLLAGSEIERLLGRPLQSVFVEGGAQTLSLFIKAGYADLFHAFIAPTFTGGQRHRIFVDYLLKQALRLETLSSFRLGRDTVVEMVPTALAEKVFPTRDY